MENKGGSHAHNYKQTLRFSQKTRNMFLVVCCLTLWCCNPDDPTEKSSNPLLTTTTVAGEKFFEFDEIDYYFNDYEEENIIELSDNASRSELDSLKEGFIIGDIPQNLSDLQSLDKLGQMGFKKSSIDKSEFAAINDIFSVKPVDEVLATACIYIYRDILVFKKQDKITGVAKICFDCLGHHIIGTRSNTDFFGQNGDFKKLSTLLRSRTARKGP